MQPSKTDIWVGLFVMLGAAALVFLALRAGNLLTLDFSRGYEVTARFDNIGGLTPQAAVRSAGVKVGRVKNITFNDKTFQADVLLELSNSYQFPSDSSFKILTSGLLGDQYVGVDAGFEEKHLAAGDTILNTQSAVVLENLIGQFLYGKANEGAAPKPAE